MNHLAIFAHNTLEKLLQRLILFSYLGFRGCHWLMPETTWGGNKQITEEIDVDTDSQRLSTPCEIMLKKVCLSDCLTVSVYESRSPVCSCVVKLKVVG